MTKWLPLSTVKGLAGAVPSDKEPNVNKWMTMDKILEKFDHTRKWTKSPAKLKAQEWQGFGRADALYFLMYEHHCFVLLHDVARQLAFIADGGNVARNNRALMAALRNHLSIRLVSLEYVGQLGVDHCGSSAILIGLELAKMHARGLRYTQLTVCKKWRAELINTLHPHKSAAVEQPSLHQRRIVLTCTFCGKNYKSNQGRALKAHIDKLHRT